MYHEQIFACRSHGVSCGYVRACARLEPVHQCLCPFASTLCALARALTILAVTALLLFLPPAHNASWPRAGATPTQMSAIFSRPDFPCASAPCCGTRVGEELPWKDPACGVIFGSLARPVYSWGNHGFRGRRHGDEQRAPPQCKKKGQKSGMARSMRHQPTQTTTSRLSPRDGSITAASRSPAISDPPPALVPCLPRCHQCRLPRGRAASSRRNRSDQ